MLSVGEENKNKNLKGKWDNIVYYSSLHWFQ